MSSDRFSIRPATAADSAIIAGHRVSMFRDMGVLAANAAGELHALTVQYLTDAMPRGEYLGWLASPIDAPGTIIAGAGVQRRRVLPFPRKGDGSEPPVAEGRGAIVLNVYTEPGWRRQGLARLLMLEVLGWARESRVESLVLHAAPDGRPLYEQLGFQQTNEMRYTGRLDQ